MNSCDSAVCSSRENSLDGKFEALSAKENKDLQPRYSVRPEDPAHKKPCPDDASVRAKRTKQVRAVHSAQRAILPKLTGFCFPQGTSKDPYARKEMHGKYPLAQTPTMTTDDPPSGGNPLMMKQRQR